MKIHKIIFLCLLTWISGNGFAQITDSFSNAPLVTSISPLDYGLREAQTGIERYYALYNAHCDAINKDLPVSYTGIGTLEIELPQDFKSIPLSRHTDFSNVVIFVTNQVKHAPLFTMISEQTNLAMDKKIIDQLDFSFIPELASDDQLLILTDNHPWTERRGYGYCVYRKDIIWVHNGHGINATIAPWNTDSTKLSATYINIDTSLKVVKGLTLHRTENSSFRTNFITLNGQYNVLLEDIHITTPKSKMINDQAFGVYNSARITFRNITVDGTYSGYGRWRDYGYAFSMNNTWDCHFEHVTADGNWGVFGTNNLSTTILEDCDINRFDIHCYGYNASLHRCILKQRQTQFSSMYGTVLFDSCQFIDCIPVRIRSSYNAYTPFDIQMNNCTFELTRRHHALVNVMLLDTALNSRPELSEKCWPNLQINNMNVIVPRNVRTMYLIDPTGTLSELEKPVGYIQKINAAGLHIIRPNGDKADISIRLSSHEFATKNKLSKSW